MKKLSLCLLSALLIAFSFPTILFETAIPNLGFLAWFGLVPFICAIYDETPRRAFLYGFFTALLYFYISIYWIYIAIHYFGDVSPLLSFLPVLLLATYMAICVGLAALLARLFTQKTKGEFLIWFPIFFTLFEWARNYTPFGGFPWPNLANSQNQYTPLIQFADITGVYGVIFLLAWVNVYWAELILKFQKRDIAFFIPKTVFTIFLCAAVTVYGFSQIKNMEEKIAAAPHLNVGLIQPNISQGEKFSVEYLEKQKKIFRNAVQSLQMVADIIIWPETAWFETPHISRLQLNPEWLGVTKQKEERPYSLVGLTTYFFEGEEAKYYNSAFLTDAVGNVLGKYHKSHLVPFGEYVPWKKLFYFLSPVAAIGDFQTGESWEPLSLGKWKVAPLVCFENIFPEISRTFVKNGAHFLANISNLAWYENSSGVPQHLSFSPFRAIENRRAFVGATNTGISAVIDPIGRVVNRAPLFTQSTIVHRIPLLEENSVYTKLGDWFIVALLLFAAWQGIALKCRKN
ncbi:MAG: apolipoprotein N-acyltransferase [Deltaproteobacteria bacterium]|nr:apolipoprotein N-acyltransferase [Deltaproteobacteria bacterium]